MSTVGIRAQLNRGVALVALFVALPMVATVEKLRPGSGPNVARRVVEVLARTMGVRFVVRGRPEGGLASPSVYVPNHSSPLDIPALLTACPDIRFMAGADLFRIPLLASAMRALRTVPIDRHHPDVAHRQLDALIDGADQASDLAIFAEGGIAPRGERLPFKTGAFALAIQTGIPVVPVAIHGSADVLPPRSFLGVRPGTVVVELLEPVSSEEFSLEDRGVMRDRVEGSIRSALTRGPGDDPIPDGGHGTRAD